MHVPSIRSYEVNLLVLYYIQTSHMAKLSKQWQSARINITPSKLQVQCKIDESAAHCCLIVFTIHLMLNLSITLYIIIYFHATVHLLKHTHRTETDHGTVHL